MKRTPIPLLSAAAVAAAVLASGQAQAALLGYWNFDGPASSSVSERLKDQSGNNYHGNDRNAAGTTKVLFNNQDVPRAPFLVPPGNENYCLDLSGGDRYVVMEGATGIAAAGAVSSAGNAFNIGNSSSAAVPAGGARFTVSYWYKGLGATTAGAFITKGGDAYGTPGVAGAEGWAVRRADANIRMAFVTRGLGGLPSNGGGDPGWDYSARSGGTLANPQLVNVLLPPGGAAAGVISDNHGFGFWQHCAMVWDGNAKHWYWNGGHVRSESIGGGTYVGSSAPLAFGADINPNTNSVVTGRIGRGRLDDIAIWDEALTPAQIEDLSRGADPRRALRTSMRPFDFTWPQGTTTSYSSFYPTGQGSASATDGIPTSRYLNRAGRFSGFIHQNATAIANSFVITTGPDFPDRDPVSYEIYGTTATLVSADNSGGRAETTAAWTLIASGALALPAARSTAAPAVSFTNATSYPLYKIIFPALNGGSFMQIGECRLYTSTDGTGAPIPSTPAPRAIAEPSIPLGLSLSVTSTLNSERVHNILDGLPATRWQSWGGPGSGFIVTPAAASTVASFKWTSSNTDIARDPSSWELYGTNDTILSLHNSDGNGGEAWTLLGSGRLNHANVRSAVQPAVTVANSTAWTSYKMVFPTSSGDITSLQLADVQFYGTADGTGTGVLAVGNAIRPIGSNRMTQNSAGSFFAGYTGGPILPTGSPGTLGLFEMRVTSNLKRPEGQITATTNQVYALDSPLPYARWGMFTAPFTQPGTAGHPFGRVSSNRIDYGDPQSGGNSGYNALHTDILTNTAADDNYLFQLAQGCFRVPAAGRYTFTMRGDDGSALAIGGATWVARYSDNGGGSFIGEHLQNGMPTGDTNVLAVAEFAAPGDYNFRYMWDERDGGAWDEVFYAQGDRSSFDAALFKQLGDATGGLSLVDHKPIVEIRSSSLYVLGGVPASITLTLDGSYATDLRLSGGTFSNTDVLPLTASGYGQVTIPAPSVTTTYTLTGTRAAGTPVSSSATVTVGATPLLTSFAADDTTLTAGASAALHFSFSGLPFGTLAGTTFSLSDGVNAPVDITSSASPFTAQGGYSFAAPAATTTYTLTLNSPSGTNNRMVTIQIGVPPVINSFTISDSIIRPEGTVILAWSATGANSGTLSPNIAPVTLPAGSACDNPTDSTSYTLTVANGFGSATASVITTVAQPLGVNGLLWTVKQAFANTANAIGTVNNLTDADTILNAPNGDPVLRAPSVTVTGVPFIDYADGASGLFGNNRPPPGGEGDNYAIRGSATLVVNYAGTYTFGINNDDGGKLLIDLNQDGDFYLNPAVTVFNPATNIYDAGENVIIDNTEHAPATFTGTVTLNPGTYAIEYVYFEDGGGQAGEVFYYVGTESFLLDFTIAAPPISTPDLIISEFLADNQTGLRDGEGDREDWIEIYNGTAAPINLNNYWLSDDVLVKNKWQFPSFVLPPNSYKIVFASSKNRTVGASEFHTNFKLDPDGEHLGLYKSDGGGGYTMISGWLPAFPAQYTNRSYGFWDSEMYVGYFATPTPGSINNGGYDGFVPDIKFSVDRGVYTTPQSIALTLPPGVLNPGDFQIRYTTDGSIPGATNGTRYTTPITISQTTALRAAATRKGWKADDIDTHTYLFFADVPAQTAATATAIGFPSGSVNGQVYQYGMGGVNSGQQAAVQTTLSCIPTMSLVVDQRHFSNATTGIYSSPNTRAREVPCSLELINEGGTSTGQFQINCGLRIRGGYSRDPSNPKHAFRFFFSNRYEGPLNYRIFQAEGASRFEKIDLRCAQNYSWSFNSDPDKNTFLREELSRDLQKGTGQPYSRCRYFHLFINGIYWGLYDTDERFEASFGQTYLGGSENNYDVVKSAGSPGGYTTEATDGYFNALPPGVPPRPGDAYWSSTLAAWRVLFDKARAARATPANANAIYWEVQGLQPDGRTPLAGNPPPLLDVNNLMDYLLVTWYCGSFDAPLSTFLNNASNNWFGMRNPETRRGFIFGVHDFEHGSGTDRDLRSFDRIGPFGGSVNQNAYNFFAPADPLYIFRKQGVSASVYNTAADIARSNPHYLHEDLAVNSLEYRVRFWDRVHKHYFNNGTLRDPQVLTALAAREATVDCVILAEQARWGDTASQNVAKYNTEKQYMKDWIARGSNPGQPLSTNYGRGNTIVTLLRGYRDGGTNIPLYSPINAPVYAQMGGVVLSGFNLGITIPAPNAPAGTIYYTTNGEDPRAVGGAINTGGGAATYPPGGLVLTQTANVRSRVWDGTNWSALTEALFIVGVPATAAQLVITEINYNPPLNFAGGVPVPGTPNATDGAQSFEFIELQNVSADTIDLTSVAFTFGINYTFPTGRLLGPGERIVVAKDPVALATRYPDASYPGLSAKTVGGYTNALDNSGERLTLTASGGTIIRDLNPYDDRLPWPESPDGDGSTLVFTTCPNVTSEDPGNPLNWSAHQTPGGNPGGPDTTAYSDWAATNSASAGGTGDADADGMSDLLEYVFAGSTTGSSTARWPVGAIASFIVGANPATAYQTISFTRSVRAGDVKLAVEVSDDLAAANWTQSAVYVSRTPNPDGTETFVYRAPLPLSGDRRNFMRVRITCDPIP